MSETLELLFWSPYHKSKIELFRTKKSPNCVLSYMLSLYYNYLSKIDIMQ